jgi:hypothetical protein
MTTATAKHLAQIDETFEAVARLIQLRKIADHAPDEESRMTASNSMYYLASYLRGQGVSETLLDAIFIEVIA